MSLDLLSWKARVPAKRHEPAACSPPEEAAPVPSVLRKIAKWASKPSCGKPVWPTRFIPSKTPLTEELIQERFPVPGTCAHPHTVPRLLKHCSAKGWPVGLIINLCAQDGLYAADVPSDLLTFHVGLESKSLPSEEDVAKVIQHAAQFWQEHPDAYILMHCAYALASFAHSREGGMHHEDFRQELLRRFAHVPAPIQSFNPQLCGDFYSGKLSAGRLQLQELWHAAGHTEGDWMLSAASSGKVVQHSRSGRWSVATDDSHNDLESLLIASQESGSTTGSAAHGTSHDTVAGGAVAASSTEL